MAGMKSLEIELDGEKDMVLIASDDSVWFTVRFRWWDIATMIWFFLWPAERRAVIYLNLVGGERVRCRAIKIASKYARLSGRPK